MVPQQGLAATPASAVVVAHCEPAGMQQRRPAPPDDVHWRLPQQSAAVLQPGSPAGLHATTGRRHSPPSQVVPVQHSVLSTHESPSDWHAQRPPSQSM